MKKKTVSKRKTIGRAKKAAWAVFSPFIRMRDCLEATGSIEYGECFSCGEPKKFSELDAGHFVPKRAGNYFSEMGVHSQCVKCNRFQGGNQLGYRRHLVELYGEAEAGRLEWENQIPKKFTIEELEELKKYYQSKIKEMEA